MGWGGNILGAAAAFRADLLGITLGGGSGCKRGACAQGGGGGGAIGASRSSWMYRCWGIGGLVGTLGGDGSTAPSCSGMVALVVTVFCAGTAAASENILLRRDSSEKGDSWRYWGNLLFSAVARFWAADMTASSGVMLGFEMYLCFWKTVLD